MGESKPHSKTVRGTLDNPKTQEAMKSDKPTPQPGDPTSLKPENDDKKLPSNDSAPPRGQGNNSGANVGAPTPSNPSGELPHSKKARGTLSSNDGQNVNKTQSVANVGAPTSSNPSGELPHSKKVRGTLSNNDGKKVNKTQLGDPASLKAETSNTNDMDKGTEREGQDKSGKSKL